jgi:mannose-1-phosphate guanylyltransferase
MNSHHYVCIMAGGIGSRFWPMSRTNFPKQFLDILNTGESLLQATHRRFASFVPAENIYVVTSDEYGQLVKDQLPQMPPENVLCEPSRKNTAPCVAYMAFKLLQKDPEASFIVAPSDHLISDTTGFTKVCLEALSFVDKHNALITLGIKPTYPNTGYGYIQYEEQPVTSNVYKVKLFTEKPNLELAKTFIASGDFLWNAGIFVWKAKSIVDAYEKFLPEMYEVFAADTEAFNTAQESEAINRIYPLCSNVSIDIGIMEKANNVYIIPSAFGWSDLGAWNSAYDNMGKDEQGNALSSTNMMTVDAANNVVYASADKLVLIQGLEEYIVVDTADVLLICKRDREQAIKEYVGEIKRNKGERYL